MVELEPEVIILTPESSIWDWQEADPLVAALIEQGGVVIAVDYDDDPDAAAFRAPMGGDA